MPKLFGTNGVRGIVNEEMNVDLGLRLGKAVGSWLEGGVVCIGTDTRISNQMMKNSVASGLMACGCDVIDLGEAPTPAIQLYTRENCDLGIAITASHNPPEFNGIKCIDSDGTELIRWKEAEIEELYFDEEFDLSSWDDVGDLSSDDPLALYKEKVMSKTEEEFIQDSDIKVAVDCANGAGCHSMPYILREIGCEVVTLNSQPDGMFPGHDSEPTEENLQDLAIIVERSDVDLGLALDGDADRAIFFDEKGNFLHGDKTLTLMAKKIVKDEEGGTVVTPVSSSSSVEDVVEEAGGDLIYTAVGSPIVAREMIEKDAIFGGEENGGLIFAEHQYCRDAAMATVKIIGLMAKEGDLSSLVEELPDYKLDKRGVECPDDLKEKLLEELKEYYSGERYDDTDGLKIYYKEGWVLIRPSGTEPKYRIYSEAKEEETAERFGKEHEEDVRKILEQIS